ncbi:MAG TPA: LptF/LptG family permease [Caulobacteraceae bacterium]|nr:LptF/LptG family permease [Caulobacteraceae bacterium]
MWRPGRSPTPIIDRYLFRQLLAATLLATAALSAIAILSQSLSELDLLVNQRQTVWIFLKVILLAMPQILVLVLPAAMLIAALTAFNRLHNEHEIVVCFLGGMSRWRVLAPALRLAGLAALLSLALTLWAQPFCFRIMRDTLHDVRTDLAASLVQPGRFTHPAPGVTAFATAVEPDGLIRGLFLDVERPGGREATITARSARLVRRGGEPMLLLRSGANEEFNRAGVLTFLSFDEYVFDLRPFIALEGPVRYKFSDRYLHELFFPDLRRQWDAANRAGLEAEGHARLTAPLYNIAFMILAAAAVLGGPFSKFGYARRIAWAGAAALLARTLGFAFQTAAVAQPALNVMQYLIPLATAGASAGVLLGIRGRARRDAAPGLV